MSDFSDVRLPYPHTDGPITSDDKVLEITARYFPNRPAGIIHADYFFNDGTIENFPVCGMYAKHFKENA